MIGNTEKTDQKEYNRSSKRSLLLKPTRNTPYVLIDYLRGTVEFKGRSSPQDAISFFRPIFRSLGDLKGQSKINVVFNMEYFNTSSAKCIFNVFRDLSEMTKKGANVHVDWMYDEFDDDMMEVGEDIEDLTSLDFNFLPYN